MKKAALITALLFSVQANANTFDWVLERVKKYAIPCAATVAVGSFMSKKEGMAIGAVGCTAVISYGEFADGSNIQRGLTEEELATIRAISSEVSARLNADARSDFGVRLESLSARVESVSNQNRDTIKGLMTDMAVIMESDLIKEMDRRMKNPDFMPAIQKSISERVKEEVFMEMKLQKPSLIQDATTEVIKRVTIEPMEVPEGRVKKEKAEDKK